VAGQRFAEIEPQHPSGSEDADTDRLGDLGDPAQRVIPANSGSAGVILLQQMTCTSHAYKGKDRT
jgi:hypothetical protein